VSIAVVSLIRPTDSLFLAAPLVVAALVDRHLDGRQRVTLIAWIAAGLVIGWGEWIVEAFLYFHGPLSRFRAGRSEIAPGLHFVLGLEAASLRGVLQCIGCKITIAWWAVAWWFAIPPLAGIGIWSARRRAFGSVLAIATALIMAFQYLVTIDYAAPRFLLPVYALIAVPCGEGVVWLLARRRVIARAIAIGVAVVVLAAHGVVQLHVFDAVARDQILERDQYVALARALEAQGVARPCEISGPGSAPVAFAARCGSTLLHGRAIDPRILASEYAVVLSSSPHARASAAYASWPPVLLTGEGITGTWYAYIHAPGAP
jgi:hypothetical protein